MRNFCIFYVNVEIIIITKTSLHLIFAPFVLPERFYRMVSAFFLFVIF